MKDLDRIMRSVGIQVAVAALDLAAEPGPPPDFSWEYPGALAPFLQFVLPRARDGEAGIVDYEGRWTVAAIAEAAADLQGPIRPELPAGEVVELDSLLVRPR